MILRRWAKLLARPITVLVVPHGPSPLIRAQFSLAFGLFGLALWTGITVWAGFLAGQRIDYWVTKIDNRFLRDKVRLLAGEIGEAREVLDEARETDRRMRDLLGLDSRQAIVEGSALGGPTGLERLDLARLAAQPERVPQPEVQREVLALRRESELRVASFQEITWHIDHQRSVYRATPKMWPTSGTLTSPFGYRFSPTARREAGFGEFHPGVDIANTKVTSILATADGVVRHSGWSGGYGQLIMVDHGHGFTTLYGHTSKVVARKGQRVERGEVIGYMGTTGRSTGKHLHYEVWRDGKPVNPIRFMGPRRGGKELVARDRR